MRAIIAGVLLSSFGVGAIAAEDGAESFQAALASAKFLGGCGILSQMAGFQQSTKMNGGDEFITRFMSTEAARLGVSVEKYMEACRQAGEYYQLLFDASAEEARAK